MQFIIKFRLLPGKQVLPLNYKYPMSSWIYQIIRQSDNKFAEFLHNQGYQLTNAKTFKLFTFSDLLIPKGKWRILPKTDRMVIWADSIRMKLAFQLPMTAESFIQGLFYQRKAIIGDQVSQITLQVEQINAIKPAAINTDTVNITALSPIILAYQHIDKKHKTYLQPNDPLYQALFLKNLLDKYQLVTENKLLLDELDTNQLCFNCLTIKPKSRKQTIKAFTASQTEVRGFLYDFALTAPKELIEIGLFSGFGAMNALGFGMGEIKQTNRIGHNNVKGSD